MATQANPISIRDVSRGIYRSSSVNSALAPSNSVSHSINMDYEQILGSAVVRKGTTLVGGTVVVVGGATPLGLTSFTSADASTYKNIVAVFSGASTGSVYYYDTSWHTSNLTSLSNSAKNRFANLGDDIFLTNITNGMYYSADGGATWVSGSTVVISYGTSISPSLVFRSKQRLLASGDTSQSPSRVFFSSVVDPTAVNKITWSTDSSTGDWIDINPDDGDYITGFAETSNTTLVFKSSAMYRLDVINKSTNTLNVFNVGAVSQEAITNCRGVVYFFSGNGIYRTVGDVPEEISRLGVQDWIDAISQSSWTNVCAGTDDRNVYFSIGDVTLNSNQDNEKSYTNIVLKWSIRDETWSVHSYAQEPRFFARYVDTNGKLMRSADTSGAVQTINLGTTDNSTPIYYELETQDIEYGNRSHLKKIADKIIVYSKNGMDSQLQARQDGGDYKDIATDINGSRVYICEDIDLEGYFFNFRFFGQSSGTAPVFEGIYCEDIVDLGVTKK